jgi:hypothetical protein
MKIKEKILNFFKKIKKNDEEKTEAIEEKFPLPKPDPIPNPNPEPL